MADSSLGVEPSELLYQAKNAAGDYALAAAVAGDYAAADRFCDLAIRIESLAHCAVELLSGVKVTRDG